MNHTVKDVDSGHASMTDTCMTVRLYSMTYVEIVYEHVQILRRMKMAH
jgi:hypothetical protein